MPTFTASNGITVRPNGDGGLMIYKLGDFVSLGLRPERVEALREFFLGERDEHLGRWRWPENPEYVVYTRLSAVLVVDERTWDPGVLYRRGDSVYDIEGEAARAFFVAHPDPRPWEEAQPEEVWLLTYGGIEMPWIAGRGDFSHLFERAGHSITKRHKGITAGRRIWPEATP